MSEWGDIVEKTLIANVRLLSFWAWTPKRARLRAQAGVRACGGSSVTHHSTTHYPPILSSIAL